MCIKIKICLHCGKEFVEPKNKHNRAYCSQKCANKASGEKRSRERLIKVCACATCGKVFTVPICDHRTQEGTIKYCSKECSYQGSRTRKPVRCLYCGKEFETTRLKFCSPKCGNEYKKAQNPGNGFWYENGYIVIYNHGKPIKEHIKIIQDIIGRELMPGEIVHHINGIKDDNRPENLILMSDGEHSRYHRKLEVAQGKKLFK